MDKDALLIELETLGKDIPRGGSTRAVCPVCKAEHEQSFMISRNENGQLTGYCFRVSCPSTVVGARQAPEDNTSYKRPFTARRYEGRAFKNRNMMKWLDYRYRIPENASVTERVMYNPDHKRLVFPVYDQNYLQFGYKTKSLKKGDPYKWITYYERDTNRLHYPRTNLFANGMDCINSIFYNKVVLVEDILSAIRISCTGVKAVAGLGTSFTMQQAMELSSHYDGLIAAYDPDAYRKSLKLREKFDIIFRKGIKVAKLQYDPKDYGNDHELLEDLGL